MPKNVFNTHPMVMNWTAGGGIALELSPKPVTMTRICLSLATNLTTSGSAGTYEDPWDRILSTLTLAGGSPTTTFFDFRSARVMYHALRFWKNGVCSRRPSDPGNSQTNLLTTIQYLIHFGVAPRKLDTNTGAIVDNPYDLTAGIPPVSAGSLTLQGSFGAANAGGSGWTMNNAPMSVFYYGVQPVVGDPPESFQPRGFPKWSTATPTPTATSAQFGTPYNLPAGDFIRSLLLEQHQGSNLPRSDAVLGSLKLYDQLNSRDIWKADVLPAGTELAQATALAGMPPSDNGTVFSPDITHLYDPGLVPLPFHLQTRDGDPLYGADMRNLSTGDMQLQMGINNATACELWVAFERYGKNPAHPANAAPSAGTPS